MTRRSPLGPVPPALAFALALVALAAAPARAEDDTVGVVVTGEATMQPQLVAQLETWLRTHGHDLVSAPLPPDAINALIDCFVIEDQACARKVVERRAKSRAVVFALVDVAVGATAIDRTVTLTAYWLAKGKDAITERRVCARCTDDKMRDGADELMIALARAGSDRGLVKLTSTPPGASVTVAGKVVGKTPLDYSLREGEHQVVLAVPGRPAETRKLAVLRGQTQALDVVFGEQPPSAPNRTLAYAALGGGAVLALAGGLLFVLDEDMPPPTGPQEPRYRDSAPLGVGLAAGGAVVLAIGAYLVLRAPGRGADRRATPTAAVVPGGGMLGWAGRF